MVKALQMFQYELLWGFDALVRGYITVGDVYHKNGLLFGEGYIRAFKVESEASDSKILIDHAPRIIIDDQMIKEAQLQREGAKQLVDSGKMKCVLDDFCLDEDGKYFINIFAGAILNKDYSKENLEGEMSKIRTFINDSKEEHKADDGIMSKYIWLEKHMDSFEETSLST